MIILPNPPPDYDPSAEAQRNQLIEQADNANLKAGVDNTITPGTRVLPGAWDDLRFPASGLNPPGPDNAPTVDANTGLLVFANNATRITAGVAQMPHRWVQSSPVRPHVHWIQPAAGNVLWRLEYRVIPAYNAEFPGTWTTIENHQAIGTYPGSGDFVQVTNFPEIPMTDSLISSMIVFRFSRVGGDVLDSLNSDVRLLEFDIHYQVEGFGSREEFIK